MKKLLQIPLLLVALFLTSIPISAHDFEVSGIYYNILTDSTVEVTYRGSSYNSYYDEYTGTITIPSSVAYNSTSYLVTSIGAYAFEFSSLTSITIPESVRRINDYAFWYSGLTSITIPKSVTSIGNSAFSDCNRLTSITIPKSVTSIGNSAFSDCDGLTSITIPESVTYIGYDAFDKTPWYNNQPDGVVYINNVLYSYKGTMPEGTSIDIKEGTISITENAFCNCTGLTSVTIPNSVTSIGEYAFSYCTGLSKIIVDSENTVFDSRDNCNAIISTFTNTLIVGCKNTSIPNSVKSIIYDAFYGCTGLTSITIPESVTHIGGSAFYGCTGLTSITIPESVTHIGGSAFYGCTGLTEVNITDLSAWCKIGFDDNLGNPLYHAGHLKLNGTEITDLVIPDDITEIKPYAFRGCTGLTSVTIPNSVTSIGNNAFSGCTGLTSVTIPSSVTSIGNNAFGECVNLASVELPNPWPTIGDYAFGRTGLTFVNVPNSQTNIDPNVFRDCPNLCINIEKGNDPILIKKSRTFRCNKVYIGRPISYVGTSSYTNLFDSISELAIDYEIKVLSDEMFKYAKNLKVLSIGNGESVLKIGYLENSGYYDSRGKGLFYNLPLDSVYIGRPISYDAAKCYGYSPFADVKTLRHLTLDCNNINTTLMPYFFENCNSLETVIIQNSHSQMSLPAEFFKGCVNLKSLTLPFPGTGTAQTTSNFGELFGTESNSNMRAVTQYFEDGTNKTYYLPTGLDELVLTEGCEMIPYGGLYNCNMLKRLTLPTSLYMVGDKALYGCAQIADIYCKGADPAVAYDSSFDGMRLTSCKLHVPFNSSERYKISDGWKRFYYVEEEAPLVVSVAKNIENAGVVYGINEYQPGQVAEVEAVAHSGYTFVGWYENGNLLTTDSKYTIMVTESHSLVAMFAPVLDENDVEVSPKAENVTLSWAQETGAAYYNIDIYSNAAMTMPVGSMVVDNSGQPVSRSVTAVSATIDGLSELQNYYYSITAYGAEETILSKYTGSFSTIAGVEEVMGNTNAVEIARYDIHGHLLSAPIKGINIVKMSNGSTRKEFVK